MQSSTVAYLEASSLGLASVAFNPNKLFFSIAILLLPQPDSNAAKLIAINAFTPY